MTDMRIPAAVGSLLIGLALVVLLAVRADSAPGDQVSRGRATVTTSSTGYVSIEHSLGVPPALVVATACGISGGTSIIPSMVITDSYAARTFRARVLDQLGRVVASTSVSVCWIAYLAEPAPPPPPPTPTPTTTAPAVCGGPITITAGGTYSGCYQSSSAGTPAVTISTASPVTLDHAHVIAKGYGVIDTVAGVQLTVTDSVFEQTDPGAVVDHRAIALTDGAGSVDVEHNSFTNGDGIWIAAPTAAIFTVPGTVKVNYNTSLNIGRYPNPKDFGCCVQFLQFTQVNVPGAEVGWNKMTNVAGQSGVEDNVNFYKSGGSPASPTNVHHNLVDGAYPVTNDTGFTGGGLNLGDLDSHDNVARNNTVVSTTNYGVGVANTSNYAYDNLLVNDGAEQVSAFGQAATAYPSATPAGLHTSGNTFNWHRSTTDATQYPCYPSSFCSNGVQVATTEQQARDAWDAARVAAGITVGVR